MIVISDKPGQLGNLLFIYAHFIAYGRENHVTVVNPAFHAYRSYFSGTHGFSITCNTIVYKFCYFISRVLFRLNLKKGPVKVVALGWEEHLDLEHATELKNGLCFAQGWLFRSNVLLVKHKAQLTHFFTPAPMYAKLLTAFFNKNFVASETVIGIHIRRGDYKTFESGTYFYSPEDYLSVMKQLALLFQDKCPHFLISSNEKITFDPVETKDLKITFAPGHELIDLLSLSKCDYIAGPPSTYSMWASFYGGTALYEIKDVEKKIEMTDFKLFLS